MRYPDHEMFYPVPWDNGSGYIEFGFWGRPGSALPNYGPLPGRESMSAGELAQFTAFIQTPEGRRLFPSG